MKNFFKKKQKVDEWNSPDCDPIKDCMSALMGGGYSEREAEMFLECLMGKRKYDIDLHFDFMTPTNCGEVWRNNPTRAF